MATDAMTIMNGLPPSLAPFYLPWCNSYGPDVLKKMCVVSIFCPGLSGHNFKDRFSNTFSRKKIFVVWGLVTHICIRKLCHHWFRSWLLAWFEPSHYLTQWWFLVNLTLMNIFHRNCDLKSKSSSFQKMHLKMWSAKMVIIFSGPQWVKIVSPP